MQSNPLLFQLFLSLHLIGLALGLGGVVITDFSLIRALKMGDRITVETVVWMRSFSAVIWAGLGVLTISGLGLFMFHPGTYLSSPGFMAKMIFVAVLTINGLFLNFYATARLTTFNFSEKYQHRGAAWRARKLSFIFGAISTTSWYAVVFTAMFKSYVKLSFLEYLAIFALLLIFAVTTALALEWRLSSVKNPTDTNSVTVDRLAFVSPAQAIIQTAEAQNKSTQNAHSQREFFTKSASYGAESQVKKPSIATSTANTFQPPAVMPMVQAEGQSIQQENESISSPK